LNESKLLIPTLHFRFFERALVKELTEYFNDKFGLNKDEIKRAIYKADDVQTDFENRLIDYGKEVLNNIPVNAVRWSCWEDHIIVRTLT